MTFKKIVKACLVFCITAVLWIALCGCDDLGAYEDTTDYYSTFDDIALISATSRELNTYPVDQYFYNKESREDFLVGDDGVYGGVVHSDYVYMAIPLTKDIKMDSLALFMQSKNDVTVYINVFITDEIPSKWQQNPDNDESDADGNSNNEEFDDPNPDSRIGEIVLPLKSEKWDSFVLDSFTVSGEAQKSIQIKNEQYVLLQIRNNSGVRIFDEEKQLYVDPQTGLELQKAEITMTNLLVRALEINSGN